MYFFDVHVLDVRMICMRCEESKHNNSESCNRRIKRWKYPRISAFLRRLFGKLKDVFFKKSTCVMRFFCEHHSYLMRNVNPMSPPRNAYVTKKKRRGNNKSHRLIEKWERRCVGEERTVLCPPRYVEWEGRRGMKRGEKRLLDFLFFFWRWDFFKIRGAQRAPLELPFFVNTMRRRAARLSA